MTTTDNIIVAVGELIGFCATFPLLGVIVLLVAWYYRHFVFGLAVACAWFEVLRWAWETLH